MTIYRKAATRIALLFSVAVAMSGCKDGDVRDTGYPAGGNDGHSHYSAGEAGSKT